MPKTVFLALGGQKVKKKKKLLEVTKFTENSVQPVLDRPGWPVPYQSSVSKNIFKVSSHPFLLVKNTISMMQYAAALLVSHLSLFAFQKVYKRFFYYKLCMAFDSPHSHFVKVRMKVIV